MVFNIHVIPKYTLICKMKKKYSEHHSFMSLMLDLENSMWKKMIQPMYNTEEWIYIKVYKKFIGVKSDSSL